MKKRSTLCRPLLVAGGHWGCLADTLHACAPTSNMRLAVSQGARLLCRTHRHDQGLGGGHADAAGGGKRAGVDPMQHDVLDKDGGPAQQHSRLDLDTHRALGRGEAAYGDDSSGRAGPHDSAQAMEGANEGVNEAAEALIGLVGTLDGGRDGGDGEDGAVRSKLVPGRIVWAKVEGHDWWPAKVVRRRAMPREVGAGAGDAGPICRGGTAAVARVGWLGWELILCTLGGYEAHRTELMSASS